MKTIKIMKRLMGCAAAILALTACSESEDLLAAYHSDSKAVHITAQVGKASADGFTRSNPLGDAKKQTEFNENDEISVKADGQDAVTYKLVGSEWQPQGSKFLKWEKETMNFTAYYPASFNGTINQPEKYNSEDDLAAADFMSFSGPQTNTNKSNQLTLTMNRLMARVVVEIADFNDQYTKNATVKSVTINGNIKAYKHEADGKFYALINPNSIPGATAPFLSLEVEDGTSKTTETLTTTPTFAAGKSYTYKLTVGKNKISVSGITVSDWTPGEIIPDDNKAKYIPYVTFKADEWQTFQMITNDNYKITELEYSVNGGDWITLTEDSHVSFGAEYGDLRLRGKNHSGTSSENCIARSFITFTKENVPVACTGDIRTLLDWEKYKTVNTENARFYGLFMDCKALTSAPELPATKLASNCYSYMFYGCTKLNTAPALPATTLAQFCYQSMFKGCTNLKTAPALPAETLVKYCYQSMFWGCTNLTSVTMLASGEQIYQSTGCFDNWLYNAGTAEGITRTLKVKDADAYSMLERISSLHNWEKGTEGTTVLDENGNEIK